MATIEYNGSTLNLDTKMNAHRAVTTVSGDKAAVQALHAELENAAGMFTVLAEVHGNQFNLDVSDFVVDALNKNVSKQTATVISNMHDAVSGDVRLSPNAAVEAAMASKEYELARKALPEGELGDAIGERVVADMVAYRARANSVRSDSSKKYTMGEEAVKPAMVRAKLTLKINDVPEGAWKQVTELLADAVDKAVNEGLKPSSPRATKSRSAADFVERGDGKSNFGPGDSKVG